MGQFVASNTLLASLSAYEEGTIQTLSVSTEDMEFERCGIT